MMVIMHGKYLGGKRENNEDIVDALIREVKEETGLIINDYKLVYVSPIFENHPFLKPFLNIGYLCFVDNSDVIISNEHIGYKWVDVEELANHLDNDIYNDLLNNGMIMELEKNMIKQVCDLLRKELYNNNYEYGFYCDGKKYKPNMNNGFDSEFYNLLLTTYKVQNPIDTMREKIGTCNDVVLVMKKILDEEKIQSKIWLLYKKVNNKVHTILTFNVCDKTIYLELTPQSNKPYYGKEIIYNNEDELKKEFQNQGYDVIDISNDIAPGEYPEFSLKLIK